MAFGLGPINSFAYPYGTHNALTDTIVRESYLAARTALISDGGFNLPTTNPYLLKTQSVEQGISLDTVKTWVDTAANSRSWLILVLHKVDNSGGQYSISPQRLAEIVDYIKTSPVSVVTVSEGYSQMAR